MQIGYKGGKTIRVGHKVMGAAVTAYRTRRRDVFQEMTAFLLKQDNSPALQDALLTCEKEFSASQIPSDSEVGEFLRTWEGRRIALQAAFRTEKIDADEADEILDGLSENEYETFTTAIEGLLYGARMANMNRTNGELTLESMEIELSRKRAEVDAQRTDVDVRRAEVDLRRKVALELTSSETSDTSLTDDAQTPPVPETQTDISAPEPVSDAGSTDTAPSAA